MMEVKAVFTLHVAMEMEAEIHTNPVEWRQNILEQKGLFSSVSSPFYRVCMEFHSSVSVSGLVSAVN